MNKNPMKRASKKLQTLVAQRELHLMLLPAVLAVLIFEYLPMPGILIAFKNFSIRKGIFASPWAAMNGFEHFLDFFNAPNFGNLLFNTVYIALLKLLILSFPPVILAILMNELRNERFKKITQTISYLPHFVSWVIIGGMIYSLFSYSGVVNQLLVSLGWQAEKITYLGKTSFFIPMIVLSDLWKEIGWGSIIYLSVIVSIDQNLYEAVEIDGGGRWTKIRHVTWPSILGIFVIQFILACGSIMSAMGGTFEQIYVLGNDMVRSRAEIIDTYVLKVGLENARFSFATAVGLFKSVINLVLLVSANRIARRVTGKSLF